MDGETVTAAIARLRREGKPITVRSIHALLGGSFRDLAPLVRASKELLDDAEVEAIEAERIERKG